MNQILKRKMMSGERISKDECLRLFEMDLGPLGELANIARERHVEGGKVTFVVDININITNVCSTKCDFCAFHVERDSEKAFVLTTEQILKKVENLVALGGTQVLLQGGINDELGLEYYTDILKKLKKSFDVHVHAFSPAEIEALAIREKMSEKDVILELRSAGLDSLPGGGAEILVDRVRNEISPLKISADKWLEIMRTAQSIGMSTTATMMFAVTETLEERVEHLERIRHLQDETMGFRAFIPWTFSPTNTKLSSLNAAGGAAYLKTLAVSRIFLDNIKHVGSGWVTEGMQVAQLGLHFGADDMGGILLEEKVLKAAGVENSANIVEMVKVISHAGFIPAQRNTKYEIIKEFAC